MSVIRQPVAFLMGVPVRILKGAVNVLASPIVAISTLALSQFCGKGSDENVHDDAYVRCTLGLCITCVLLALILGAP